MELFQARLGRLRDGELTVATVNLPAALVRVLGPARGSYQYRVLRGGRGSGKSVGAATIAAIWGYAEPLRILCVRQFQNSIPESFYREVVDALEMYPWLKDHYTVTKESITGKNGTQFIFKGLDRNPQSIKSLAKIDLTIVEEAEDIPEQSWVNLEATIFRQPKSEMFIIYNPRKESSPVDFRFIKNKAPSSIVGNVNYSDNPFFPAGLEILRKRDMEIFDPATYAHIWLGDYLRNSKSQIFHDRYELKQFEPDPKWSIVQGLDWGYSQDPTAMIRAYVHDECLWISHEAGRVGIELDEVAGEAANIPDFHKHTTRADSAQPAMISHVKGKGLPKLEPAKKGKGSVEDGIQFIRSFRRVYIHPRCKNTLNEFNTYSWKVDRMSGDVLDVPVDANNHYCIAEGQKVLTKRGYVAIENVATSDKVMTRDGWRDVLATAMTNPDAHVIDVVTTLGTITCTPDHPIFSGGCFVRADALSYGHEVIGDEKWLKQRNGTGKPIGAGRDRVVDQTGFTSKGHIPEALVTFTGTCGNDTTERYLKDFTSTTSMRIRGIMTYQTLNASLLRNTLTDTLLKARRSLAKSNTLMTLGTSQKNGTQAQRAGKSTKGLGEWLMTTSFLSLSHAYSALSFSIQKHSVTGISFAQTHANQNIAGTAVSTMLHSHVPIAGMSSCETNIPKRKLADGHVLTVIDTGRRARVYNLSVDGMPEFICQGILSHNCDALRYALEPIMLRARFRWDMV